MGGVGVGVDGVGHAEVDVDHEGDVGAGDVDHEGDVGVGGMGHAEVDVDHEGLVGLEGLVWLVPGLPALVWLVPALLTMVPVSMVRVLEFLVRGTL